MWSGIWMQLHCLEHFCPAVRDSPQLLCLEKHQANFPLWCFARRSSSKPAVWLTSAGARASFAYARKVILLISEAEKRCSVWEDKSSRRQWWMFVELTAAVREATKHTKTKYSHCYTVAPVYALRTCCKAVKHHSAWRLYCCRALWVSMKRAM